MDDTDSVATIVGVLVAAGAFFAAYVAYLVEQTSLKRGHDQTKSQRAPQSARDERQDPMATTPKSASEPSPPNVYKDYEWARREIADAERRKSLLSVGCTEIEAERFVKLMSVPSVFWQEADREFVHGVNERVRLHCELTDRYLKVIGWMAIPVIILIVILLSRR